jgi:membrane protease YdiL (CAAX protease family)
MPRPWHTRLGQSAITQFLVALLCIGVPFVLSNIVVKAFPATAATTHLRNGFKILVLVAAYLGHARWVERRSPFELSLPGALKEAGLGFLLGAGLISLSVGLLASLGCYHVDGINTDVPLFRYVAGFLAVAALEELIFRGVLFRLVEKSLGSVIAIALSTAVFGLLHRVNPNATWISIASLTLSSLVLVGSFLATRRLWLCVGVHWGWNLLQALCSLSVSGNETKGLLNAHVTGPAWLTGGSFGVEASLLTLMLSLITAGYLLYVAHKKGHFTAPYWRSRQEVSSRHSLGSAQGG